MAWTSPIYPCPASMKYLQVACICLALTIYPSPLSMKSWSASVRPCYSIVDLYLWSPLSLACIYEASSLFACTCGYSPLSLAWMYEASPLYPWAVFIKRYLSIIGLCLWLMLYHPIIGLHLWNLAALALLSLCGALPLYFWSIATISLACIYGTLPPYICHLSV